MVTELDKIVGAFRFILQNRRKRTLTPSFYRYSHQNLGKSQILYQFSSEFFSHRANILDVSFQSLDTLISLMSIFDDYGRAENMLRVLFSRLEQLQRLFSGYVGKWQSDVREIAQNVQTIKNSTISIQPCLQASFEVQTQKKTSIDVF